jgi:4-hydroxybenzoate polyprenyltransferase
MFDIKDIQYDQEMNIKTIPIIIGLKNIKQQLVLPALGTLFFIDIVRYYVDPSSILILWILFYYIVFNVSKLAIKEPSIDRSILLIDGMILLKVCFEFTIYFIK